MFYIVKPLLHSMTFFLPSLSNQERQWTLSGSRMVAWVAQGLLSRGTGIALDAMVAWEFKNASYSRTTVVKESGRLKVAQVRQNGGRYIAMVAEGTHSGRCVGMSDASATTLPSFCVPCASWRQPMAIIKTLLWRQSCVASTTIVQPWRSVCLHSAMVERPTLCSSMTINSGHNIIRISVCF